MNYSIQQLTYLVAIDRYRSFSKAAEHCYVTQPTLSMQIKKLENDLGLPLLDRSKQPLKFTQIGELIVEQAREALSELKVIDDIIDRSKGKVAGELRVGIIPTIAPYLMPIFLGDFLRKYPEVELVVTEFKTDEIVERLNNESIDVGILATPLKIASIVEKPLFYEKLLAYADDELSSTKGNRIELDKMLSKKLWILSEGNCFRNQTFNLCSLNQTKYKNLEFNYESGSIETLMRLVDKEGGSTIIPELALDVITEEQIDRVKFIGSTNPLREISTITRRKGLKESMINAMRDSIVKSLPKSVLDNKDNGEVVAI